MATKREIMAVGTAAPLARMLGSDSPHLVVPTGSDQASATLLEVNFALLFGATAAGQGVRLPPASAQYVHAMYNANSATAVQVWPHDDEQINGLLPGQPLSLPALSAAFFVPSRRQWAGVVSSGGPNMSTPVTLYVPGNPFPLILQADSPTTGGPYIEFGPAGQPPIWRLGDTHVSTPGQPQGFGIYAINATPFGGIWIDQQSDTWIDGRLSVGGSATGSPVAHMHGDTAIDGNLTVGGTINGAPFPSDARLKDDIQPLERGLNAVMGLEPVSWRWNGRGGMHDDGRRHYGFLADQVEPLIPEAVGTREVKLDPDDAEKTTIQTLDPDAIMGALLNAVKVLGASVVGDRLKLAGLTERVEQLERLVSK